MSWWVILLTCFTENAKCLTISFLHGLRWSYKNAIFCSQVRIYTPERVFQDLEAAKEDYIRATFGVRKDKKILLPKIVESFTKDSGLCPAGVLEMIQHSLPEFVRKNIKKRQLGKSRKSIEWVPHNFAFRYLIMKELAKWFCTGWLNVLSSFHWVFALNHQ